MRAKKYGQNKIMRRLGKKAIMYEICHQEQSMKSHLRGNGNREDQN